MANPTNPFKPPPKKVAAVKGSGGPARKPGAAAKTPARAKPKPKAVAPGRDPWSTGKIGEFINSTVGQMTGKIPSPISGAMKNPTPVIPYTQKNIKAIKKARGQ